MAGVASTGVNRYTNIVEHTGATMTSVDDWFAVGSHTSEYAFAADVSSSGNFTLALEANFESSGSWFTIDTSKTINSAGQYVYFYTGKSAPQVRMRIAAISSGTVSLTPHIIAAYHG